MFCAKDFIDADFMEIWWLSDPNVYEVILWRKQVRFGIFKTLTVKKVFNCEMTSLELLKTNKQKHALMDFKRSNTFNDTR